MQWYARDKFKEFTIRIGIASDDPSVCGGNGECIATNVCTCDLGYLPPFCSQSLPDCIVTSILSIFDAFGQSVTLLGTGFLNTQKLSCKFNTSSSSAIVAANYISGVMISCPVPQLFNSRRLMVSEDRTVTVQASNYGNFNNSNGQTFIYGASNPQFLATVIVPTLFGSLLLLIVTIVVIVVVIYMRKRKLETYEGKKKFNPTLNNN